ncbi:alpha/beta hydrolase family esterase [Corynebacterium propinquum]|uniref:alpha/beta hydrolase family esterase n=2 Tax=Corynebacterium propinquum TaxID=43769 RepID=UPI00254ACD14|nr:alpha/beta hydrolase-fold protein [Corynebacterium propinquum]MDK8535441.1 alpha/beta hydrolase-fold protein [Corynebacterium propinquum]
MTLIRVGQLMGYFRQRGNRPQDRPDSGTTATPRIRATKATGVLCALAVCLGSCSVVDNRAADDGYDPQASEYAQALDREMSAFPHPTGAPVEGAFPGETTRINLPSGRSYLVHLPADYDPAEQWPLILTFHGWGQDAEIMARSTHFDAARAISIYPDGAPSKPPHEGSKAWAPAPYAAASGHDDLEFIDEIINSARRTWSIADDQLFAVGFSNGGGFAQYLACQRPEQFHAIATVSAAYYTAVVENCAPGTVGHLDIHGTADQIVSYDGGTRHNTKFLSVPEIMDVAARRNHCDDNAETQELVGDAQRTSFTHCAAPVDHIRIDGGKHWWPGYSGNRNDAMPENFATDKILDFFRIPGRP